MNLLHWQVRDTVIILEEGNLTHPRFPHYDILVQWDSLNVLHTTTAQCAKGGKGAKQAEWKWRRLTAEKVWERITRAFRAYGWPLNLVTSLKYLGRILMASDDYLPEVVGNLRKARNTWARLSIILG